MRILLSPPASAILRDEDQDRGDERDREGEFVPISGPIEFVARRMPTEINPQGGQLWIPTVLGESLESP